MKNFKLIKPQSINIILGAVFGILFMFVADKYLFDSLRARPAGYSFLAFTFYYLRTLSLIFFFIGSSLSYLFLWLYNRWVKHQNILLQLLLVSAFFIFAYFLAIISVEMCLLFGWQWAGYN